jgi:DNA-binding GntR family transcriptional regulator
MREMTDLAQIAAGKKKAPAHETIYRAIADRILFGEFPPGQPLTLQGMADELSVSLTPVRDAVRRLVAEGALVSHDNRRVSVPVVDRRTYRELISLRLFLEGKMALFAIEHIDTKGIDRMARFDDALDQAIVAGDIGKYMRSNYHFHFTLYEYSDCRVSLPIARSIWIQLGPSHRVVCGRFGTSNLTDRHKKILSALRLRDSEALRLSLAQDIDQGNELVMRDSDGDK